MVEPICPQCGESFTEEIPSAIEDPIRIKCPACEIIYTVSRDEHESAEEHEYYFSTGPFRKNPVQMGERNPPDETSVMNRNCLLWFCIFGPVILLGILFLVDIILELFGLL